MRAGDLSAETLGNHVRLAEFGAANPTLTTDMRMLRLAGSASEFRLLARVPGPAAEMTHAIRIAAAGSETQTLNVLHRLKGLGSDDELGQLYLKARDLAKVPGRHATDPGELMRGIADARGTTGFDRWWPVAKGSIARNENGGWGSVVEGIQYGKLARGEGTTVMSDGTVQKVTLHEIQPNLDVRLPDGSLVNAVPDATVKLPDGRIVIRQLKTGEEGSKGTPENLDQMWRDATIAWHRHKQGGTERFAPKVDWFSERPPSEGQRNMAQGLMNEYNDHTARLDFKFYDLTGAPYPLTR